jgi:hypothetical protein
MSVNIIQSYLFTFYKWTIRIEKFNKKVRVPNTKLKNENCISWGCWLITLLR